MEGSSARLESALLDLAVHSLGRCRCVEVGACLHRQRTILFGQLGSTWTDRLERQATAQSAGIGAFGSSIPDKLIG